MKDNHLNEMRLKINFLFLFGFSMLLSLNDIHNTFIVDDDLISRRGLIYRNPMVLNNLA